MKLTKNTFLTYYLICLRIFIEMKKVKHDRINVYLEHSIVGTAKKYAEIEGLSFSALVEKALKIYAETGSLVNKALSDPAGIDSLKKAASAWNIFFSKADPLLFDPNELKATEVALRQLAAKNLKKIKNG